MKFTAERISARTPAADTLVAFAHEGDSRPMGPSDSALAKAFATAAASEEFKGKEKTSLLFHPPDARPARRVIVAGLGKRGSLDAERLRRAAAQAAPRCRGGKPQRVAITPPGALPPREEAQAIAEGFSLALYAFDKYKSRGATDGANLPSIVRLQSGDDRTLADHREGARRGDIVSRAACLSRDLVNEHAEVCTPRFLADTARTVARGPSLSVKVFDAKRIEKMRMGGLLAVAAGSEEPPRFIHMSYRSPGARRTVAIVGKGITFDSGGLCIKPADGMLNMKDDMGGAAAVIGIFKGLAELKPRINVHGIFGATENMPGGKAYKTRDVVRARNGKTMEIVNTDAEGRVILADALSYASELKPDEIIDLATLTGACVVALGPQISGLFSTDPKLADRLVAAGRATGEKIWPLPLEDEYWDMIKSDVADMKNSGGRYGGSITAALFLREFVDPKIPWAHIDIAGPALVESAAPYKPAGGTGVMVRTMLHYLESRAN